METLLGDFCHDLITLFQAFQEKFATNDRLNDIYREGNGPAGVHGFYMYTWAAHGMDKVYFTFKVNLTQVKAIFDVEILSDW